MACPRSHSQEVAETESEPTSPSSQLCLHIVERQDSKELEKFLGKQMEDSEKAEQTGQQFTAAWKPPP